MSLASMGGWLPSFRLLATLGDLLCAVNGIGEGEAAGVRPTDDVPRQVEIVVYVPQRVALAYVNLQGVMCQPSSRRASTAMTCRLLGGRANGGRLAEDTLPETERCDEIDDLAGLGLELDLLFGELGPAFVLPHNTLLDHLFSIEQSRTTAC